LRTEVETLLTSRIEYGTARCDSVDRVLDCSVGVFLQVAARIKDKTIREMFYTHLIIVKKAQQD
jgi:hypothetical protein